MNTLLFCYSNTDFCETYFPVSFKISRSSSSFNFFMKLSKTGISNLIYWATCKTVHYCINHCDISRVFWILTKISQRSCTYASTFSVKCCICNRNSCTIVSPQDRILKLDLICSIWKWHYCLLCLYLNNRVFVCQGKHVLNDLLWTLKCIKYSHHT